MIRDGYAAINLLLLLLLLLNRGGPKMFVTGKYQILVVVSEFLRIITLN